MPSESLDLSTAKRAARRQRAAREAYRRAILDAHAAGATFADIARAVDVSPQAVRVIVERASRSQRAPS